MVWVKEYLLILTIVFVVTLILERIYNIHLYHNRKERLETVSLFFIIGIIWDWYAIWRGHWVYPPISNTGIFIGLMPIEDYLFMLVIPYFIITIYKLVDSKYERKGLNKKYSL